MKEIECYDLQRFALFSGCFQEYLESIPAVCDLRVYDPGEPVCSEGTDGRWIYLIRDGWVEVWEETPCGAALVAIRARGECLGEQAVLFEEPRAATLRALGETSLIRIPAAAAPRLREQASVGFALVAQVCRQRQEADWRAAIHILAANERIAAGVLYCAACFGTKRVLEDEKVRERILRPVPLPLLKGWTGLADETISRRWTQDFLTRLLGHDRNGTIILRDRPGLERLLRLEGKRGWLSFLPPPRFKGWIDDPGRPGSDGPPGSPMERSALREQTDEDLSLEMSRGAYRINQIQE